MSVMMNASEPKHKEYKAKRKGVACVKDNKVVTPNPEQKDVIFEETVCSYEFPQGCIDPKGTRG